MDDFFFSLLFEWIKIRINLPTTALSHIHKFTSVWEGKDADYKKMLEEESEKFIFNFFFVTFTATFSLLCRECEELFFTSKFTEEGGNRVIAINIAKIDNYQK